jgi:hypothetical protein
MWYLIAGIGKSGTTALFQAVVDAVPGAGTSFEPRRLSKVIREFDGTENVVAKVLIHPNKFLNEESRQGLERFHKRILLIRDPRDIVVSKLMYRLYGSAFARDDAKYAVYREALERKERDPRSLSVMDITKLQLSLDGRDLPEGSKFAGHIARLVREVGDQFFTFRYEDFVDGKTEALSGYLGLPIKGATTIVQGNVNRVARSARYGDWKQWFTEDDIKVFRPSMDPFLKRFGYSTDWTLDANPAIDPKHCSLYADRLRVQVLQNDRQPRKRKKRGGKRQPVAEAA